MHPRYRALCFLTLCCFALAADASTAQLRVPTTHFLSGFGSLERMRAQTFTAAARFARGLTVDLGSVTDPGGLDFRILLTEVDPGDGGFHPTRVLAESALLNLPVDASRATRPFALGHACVPLVPGRRYAWVLEAAQPGPGEVRSASTGLNPADVYAAGKAYHLPGPVAAGTPRAALFAASWAERSGSDWGFAIDFADECLRALEYFPLAPGNTWTYREAGGLTETDTVLPGTTSVQGVPTVAVRRASGRVLYFTSDSRGLHLHRQLEPDADLGDGSRGDFTVTFQPPLQLARPAVQPGDLLTATGTAVATVPGFEPLTLDYDQSALVTGPVQVVVPAGTFSALSLELTLRLSFDDEEQGFSETAIPIFDLARHVGPVRLREQSEDEGTQTLELTDARIDTDGDAVNVLVDNCPAVANPGQEDRDRDGIGDACDPVDPATAIVGTILQLLE